MDLCNHGYNTNGVDGLAGPATYEAVIAFQRANGLAVDGQVGPATREKLLGTSSDGGSDGFPLKQGSQGAKCTLPAERLMDHVYQPQRQGWYFWRGYRGRCPQISN